MEQDAAEAFKYSTRAETWLAAREYQDDAEAIGGEGKVVQGYLMMSSVLRALAKTKKRG